MIYLIKNLSTTYTIVSSSLSDLPLDDTYNMNNGTFDIKDKVFANIMYMPTSAIAGITIEQNLLSTVDMLYESNREQILLQNKNKFIIAIIQFKPDNTKDVLYANSYLNLLKDSVEYNKLQDSPWLHYEILNYHTGKFEVHIKRDDAIEKLNQYMNEFAVEYRPNIVKEFITKEQFLEYIK